MPHRFSLIALVLGFTCAVPAQNLPAGKPAADTSALKGFGLVSPAALVDVTGQSFNKAWRVEVGEGAKNAYLVQLNTRSTIAIEKGDVLLLTFWARMVSTRSETNEGLITAIFELNGPPHTKALEQRVSATAQWTRFQFPFTAIADYKPGGATFGFHLGHGPQVLEIGGVELTSYGKEVKLEALPRTRIWYKGHEPEAPWRKAAEARIENLRKGDLTIEVLDAAGKPLASADLSVKMTRHAFPFGSAVAADGIIGDKPANEQYRQMIKKLFNRVVMENDLKWQGFEGNRNRSIAAVDWLNAQGIEVRGHCLIWPSWKYTPRDLQQLKDDPAALRKHIEAHILDETAAMKGKVVEWDVINEPFAQNDLLKVLGDAEMIQWFKLARQGDPNAVLFLNEYPTLSTRSEPHFNHFEKSLQFLIDGNAPLGGVGIQCHYGGYLPGMDQILGGLDRLAKFKRPIAVTEFDIDTGDEAIQADFMRDHMIACFSHESVSSIIMWGFWEGRHWKPRAALYRRDWSLKPCGQAWEDLVFKTWWTTAQAKTDAAGQAKVRGFLGDYEITVGGKSHKARLQRGGSKVTIRIGA